MNKLLYRTEELTQLLESQNTLLTKVINDRSAQVNDIILQCAEQAQKLGLHYGHFSKLKKCHGILSQRYTI